MTSQSIDIYACIYHIAPTMEDSGEKYSMLVQSKVAGPVAILTLNRPEAHNALNFEVRAALGKAIDRIEGDPSIRAVILTGAGHKAFAAGSDIKDMAEMTPIDSIALSEAIIGLNERIAKLRQPVICAVNGVCLGGGLELALACDIRICAETARFGFPEARLGLMTGAGGCARLVQTVGSGTARHMMLTAEIIDARRAYEIGLVTMVIAGNDLHPGRPNWPKRSRATRQSPSPRSSALFRRPRPVSWLTLGMRRSRPARSALAPTTRLRE